MACQPPALLWSGVVRSCQWKALWILASPGGPGDRAPKYSTVSSCLYGSSVMGQTTSFRDVDVALVAGTLLQPLARLKLNLRVRLALADCLASMSPVSMCRISREGRYGSPMPACALHLPPATMTSPCCSIARRANSPTSAVLPKPAGAGYRRCCPAGEKMRCRTLTRTPLPFSG